jgi:hypothetical protein
MLDRCRLSKVLKWLFGLVCEAAYSVYFFVPRGVAYPSIIWYGEDDEDEDDNSLHIATCKIITNRIYLLIIR